MGHSEGKPFVTMPTVVSGLDSIPIGRIATGGAHSFGVTVCGYGFAWGRNRWGGITHKFFHVYFINKHGLYCRCKLMDEYEFESSCMCAYLKCFTEQSCTIVITEYMLHVGKKV